LRRKGFGRRHRRARACGLRRERGQHSRHGSGVPGRASAATAVGNAEYKDRDGTSFAAPFVAGFAARLIQSARAHGRDASPAHIETPIEYSAVDAVRPSQSETHGDVELPQLPAALVRAANGALPRRPLASAGDPRHDACLSPRAARGTATVRATNSRAVDNFVLAADVTRCSVPVTSELYVTKPVLSGSDETWHR
jgi:hypothetical protein